MFVFIQSEFTSIAPQTPQALKSIEPFGEEKKDIIKGQSIQVRRSSQEVLPGIVINVQLHPSKNGTEFVGIGFGSVSIKSKIVSIIINGIIY
jgi:hypothetical protein